MHCILDSVSNLLVRHMVFVGNVQKFPIASHLKAVLLLWFLTVLAVCIYTLVQLLC